MTSTSAAVRASARAANKPPKPQPTITIRARPAPCNAPLRIHGPPTDVGTIIGYSSSGSAAAPAQTLHPRLAQRHGLGGPEGARLEAPGEPQAIQQRGEPDGGESQVGPRGARTESPTAAAWRARLRQPLAEHPAQQAHVAAIGLTLHALDQARVAVQSQEHHPHRERVLVEIRRAEGRLEKGAHARPG